jgi:cellulose synthase/poly-beta-1,6-N-acetylglucosamine synthase-like glycosyltransferase
LLDSIGFIPVLPGPCSFFRTKHLQGVLDEYFSLTTETIKGGRGGIVLGNVQLAEDRFPPVLLTFRSKDSCKDAGLVRPKTGFEHDAVFYFEAEKPLRQLVTQRRRWINGAYTAVYWVLLDSWIRKADHSIFTKLGASLILFIEFAQGALVRTCVPATLACGLMYMCTIFPSVYANDAEKVRDILDGGTVEPSLVGIGAAAAFFYLSLFAVFIFSHTPRAIPVTDDNGEVHWRSDSSSAYRPRIFFLAFVVNAITIAVFVYVGVGVFMIVGWQGTPGYFQALCLLMALPYLVALMDGLINSERPNLRAVWNMSMLFPIFLISSVWFYVWLPCYASARISDLSWGNRDCSGQSCKSSDVAIYRAYLGRVVSISLVIINTLLTGSIIGVGNFVDGFLTIVLFSLLVLNMMLHLGNLLDMLVRLCCTRIPRWVCGEAPVYLKKQDSEVNKSAPASEISSHDDESGDGSIASESPTPIGPGRWRIDF